MAGYTGEGFLGKGQTLGGYMPNEELRRRARASAKQREREASAARPVGHRLGGGSSSSSSSVVPGPPNARDAVAVAAIRRNSTSEVTSGCGTGTKVARRAAEDAMSNGFKTQEEMDEANEIAIQMALFELMEAEESHKLQNEQTQQAEYPSHGLVFDPEHGLQPAPPPPPPPKPVPVQKAMSAPAVPAYSKPTRMPSIDLPKPLPPPELNSLGLPVSKLIREAESSRQNSVSGRRQLYPTSANSQASDSDIPVRRTSNAGGPEKWQCLQCTLINEAHVARCEVCDAEQPKKPTRSAGKLSSSSVLDRWNTESQRETPLGWTCTHCTAFMESQWWTCTVCGKMKDRS